MKWCFHYNLFPFCRILSVYRDRVVCVEVDVVKEKSNDLNLMFLSE